MLANKFAADGVLLEPNSLQLGLQLYELLAFWLCNRAHVENGYVLFCITLPIHISSAVTGPVPMEFAVVPEHFIEDMIEIVVFASRLALRINDKNLMDVRFARDSLRAVPLVNVMKFAVVMMDNMEFLKNPHLRARLVDVCSSMCD